ncbi:hypothetical protein COLO4_34646 [Corchorus olitorius]|uniref:BRWD/PHIP N-terminal domain-containing protein n=1 Tax=Corchorus olitorius TaxID=93759 RepID=A0A1R3GK26_9ROSI|nr:hypothetical protein COLO4_34646 [Corchorus olitorius]
MSFPLSYAQLVERNPHIETDHLVKLLKQLLLSAPSPSDDISVKHTPNAADVPTLLGTGPFSLLSYKENEGKREVKCPPVHMRWPHIHANQVWGLALREIGGGFTRHHRAPSIRAACYSIAKPATLVQNMQKNKILRGHRNAVYCATFDRSGSGACQMECQFLFCVGTLEELLPLHLVLGQALSSDDGTCRIWDAVHAHNPPRIFIPRPSDSVAGKNNGSSSTAIQQSHQIFCCAFNANGTAFVTGSSDTLARVWNACKVNTDDSDQPNHEIDVLAGHVTAVNYVQFRVKWGAGVNIFSLKFQLRQWLHQHHEVHARELSQFLVV